MPALLALALYALLPIVRNTHAGLAVNDTAFMLAGAVPAAVLALLTQWAFDALEWALLRGPRRA